jgi:uncharacterized membrane protein (UPF0127 family)
LSSLMDLVRRGLLAPMAALALAACTPAATQPAATTTAVAEAPAPEVALEPLQVVTKKGRHAFRVAIADDEEERNRGLMFRSVLDEDEGMLFNFFQTQPLSFWMKNTLIPLDIIFIAADGRIINIAANTTPYSLEPVPSAGPAFAVLEIGGGLSAELGIKPGDRVVHRIFRVQ